MERTRLTKGKISPEVYIILRVFNLDKETIGMRLYVDPIGMEERGELIVMTESPKSYSVLPGSSART
jgi:hypothetical protein